ncbi:hypothetical protein B0H13DRAFT_460437 [Mycena leptocephala]|nr:hypothetical protein B0H13DRAFT_460437 [Mycena leptocephala]
MTTNGSLNSNGVADEYDRSMICIGDGSDGFSWPTWLVQANHIFDSLDISSNFVDYIVVEGIQYRVRLLNPRDHIPPGYLFLCPLEDLLFKDSPTCFRRPDCPAYWSFDPSGTKRLSAEEAWNCGFPNLEFRMKVLGRSWENAVYAGLRQFHEAKGFDPYSQEVALELGYPLFRVSCEPNAVLAHK